MRVREDIRECGEAVPYTVLSGDGTMTHMLEFTEHGEKIPVTKGNVIRLVREMLLGWSIDVSVFEYFKSERGWVWRRYVKVKGDKELVQCTVDDDFTHIETYYVEVIYIREERGVFQNLP